MPRRRVHVDPATAVRDGVESILIEARVPRAFSPEALAEAATGGAGESAATARTDLRALDFFTIDPPGARDLDQAMQLERDGDGYLVRYAIADVGGFVAPGGPLDTETRERGVTVYTPDGKVPLHPPVLSEDRASLLPGEDRPALVWQLRVAADGELRDAELVPALIRSRDQFDYATVQARIAEPRFELLAAIGELRQARARARGAVELRVPEQEVVLTDRGWTVRYRVPLAVEDHNAQISLLAGTAAAQIMLARGTGVLRAQPAPDGRSLDRLRRQAAALGAPWPAEAAYAEWIRSLDPAQPRHAALLHEAAGAGYGARYVAFDAAPPPGEHEHFALAMPYAHVTAPLRRLADRYALALCLEEPPGWARAGLAGLPEAMAAADRRARAVDRGVVDLVEAVLLSDRIGDEFDAVAVDDEHVQLLDPAVRAKADGCPRAGERVRVRLVEADVGARRVHFVVA